MAKYSDFVLALIAAETATGATMPLVFGSGDSKKIDPAELLALLLDNFTAANDITFLPANGFGVTAGGGISLESGADFNIENTGGVMNFTTSSDFNFLPPTTGDFIIAFGGIAGPSAQLTATQESFNYTDLGGGIAIFGDVSGTETVSFSGFAQYIFDGVPYGSATGYFLTYDPNTGQVGYTEEIL